MYACTSFCTRACSCVRKLHKPFLPAMPSLRVSHTPARWALAFRFTRYETNSLSPPRLDESMRTHPGTSLSKWWSRSPFAFLGRSRSVPAFLWRILNSFSSKLFIRLYKHTCSHGAFHRKPAYTNGFGQTQTFWASKPKLFEETNFKGCFHFFFLCSCVHVDECVFDIPALCCQPAYT